jgi:quinol monooxygenase YgiN
MTYQRRPGQVTYFSLKRAVAAALVTSLLSGCGAHENELYEARVRYARIPNEAYAVVAEIRAKPGMEDELRKATLPLVAQVRSEPNNRLYFLHEDRKAPGHFIFYEIFASQADFEAHNATPHVQGWFSRLSELADGDVSVVHLKILGNESASTSSLERARAARSDL